MKKIVLYSLLALSVPVWPSSVFAIQENSENTDNPEKTELIVDKPETPEKSEHLNKAEKNETKKLGIAQKLSQLEKQMKDLSAKETAARFSEIESEAKTLEDRRVVYLKLLNYYTPTYYRSALKNPWFNKEKANEYGDKLLAVSEEIAELKKDKWKSVMALRVPFVDAGQRGFHKARAEKMNKLIESLAKTDEEKAEISLIEGKNEEVLKLKAATVSQKCQALSEIANKTGYSTRYMRYYVDTDNPLSDKEWKEMEKKELELTGNLTELAPDDPFSWIRAGEACYIQGLADKADEYDKKALQLSKPGTREYAAALIGLANSAILRNDTAAALKYCEKVLADPYPDKDERKPDKYGSAVFVSSPMAQAALLVPLLKGGEYDNYKLPWYTGSEVFPTAREANYSKDFIALKSIKVFGLDSKDPRLDFLRQKMARMDVEVSLKEASFPVYINTPECPPAPEKTQGYSLRITKDGAWIRGYDKLGTTFGIVSLIQMLNTEDGTKIRCADIRDWPEYTGRAFQQGRNPGDLANNMNVLEVALMGKFSYVGMLSGSSMSYRAWGGNMPWTPLSRWWCLAIAKQFSAFGLNLYFGEDMYTMYPALPLTSQRTFDLHKKIFTDIAAAGGNVYYPNDDSRGGKEHPADVKATDDKDTAAKLDAKYLTKLFRAIRKDYPDFKLILCPIYYWGPDGQQNYEPRDGRETYLKSIREELDPAIEVFWNGPRVRESGKKKIHGEWALREYGRKPAIYQNQFGHWLFNYIGDEGWQWCEKQDDPRGIMYDGFYKDITFFCYNNGDVKYTANFIYTLSAYMWNPKAYNALSDAKRITGILYGKKMWDIIRPGTVALSYFEKFDDKYERNMWPAAYAEKELVKKNAAIAKDAWEKANAYNPEAMKNMPTHYGWMIWHAVALADQIDSAEPWEKRMAKPIADLHGNAKDEVALDESKGDVFIPGICFVNGKHRTYGVATKELKAMRPASPLGVRNALFIEKRGTPYSSVWSEFKADSSKNYILTFMGMYEINPDDKAPPRVSILLNGHIVYEGVIKFPSGDWGKQEINIDAKYLKADGKNRIEINNLEEGFGTQTPPFIALVYAVFHPVK